MNGDMLIYVLVIGLGVWSFLRIIKNRPQDFSKDHLSKSAMMLGYLALALIAFVLLCIVLLRQS